MTDDRSPNQPRSLLRRLLAQSHKPTSESEQPDHLSSSESDEPIPTTSQRLEAEAALEIIRNKMAQSANEYADGRLNRAQFSSLYAYYNEQRQVIERLLERNPNSQVWQSVAHRRNTDFLKRQYQARPSAYQIYRRGDLAPLTAQGNLPIPAVPLNALLNDMYTNLPNETPESSIAQEVADSQWLIGVSGLYTITVVMFMFEPSAQQVQKIADLHQDFERANQNSLARGVRQEDQFVFPHRALLETNAP